MLDYLQDNRAKLYFDFELSDDRSIKLFKKFVRWISMESEKISCNVEITPYNGIHYVEFNLEINPHYLKGINIESEEEE
ncbi:hypothetical protein [Mangrovimonas futianensis]|uniref:hypothetical protein n=1 Tax=Mangrovimonas futianensis TaxID=2895523 RepID=UPI001E366DA1|nr:hypothetical protein [Mangrovimonas futianensis]MCF1421039.1 hypothetical protein [Mangrovimonas futianensis]